MPAHSIYAIPLLLAAVTSFSLSIYSWRLRDFKGIVPFCLVSFLCGCWASVSGLDILTDDFGLKLFYMQVRFSLAAFTPLCWLLMVSSLVGKRHFLKGYRLGLLLIIPILTLIVIWTMDRHTLLRANLVLDTSGPFPVILFNNGPWYYVHVIFGYLVQASSVAFLVNALRYARNLFYRQTLSILACVFIPAIFDFLFNLYISPVPGFNFAPATFTLTSLLMGRALLRYQLFDLAPIAHSTVIETVQDLMLVFDLQNRLVDFNQSAQKVFNLDLARPIGTSIQGIFETYPDLQQKSQESTVAQREFTLGSPENSQIYELVITPLKSNQVLSLGRLFLFRNITAQKKASEELRLANEELQAKLGEIELLQAKLREETIRDPLTELFNRRYLDETLHREVAGIQRTGGYLSVVMLDIDHFKKINDTYGHKTGDVMLQALSKLLQAQTRASDITCRYGGEEFVLVMPGISIELAYRRINKMRMAFEALRVSVGDETLQSTFSAGIAVYPEHGVTGEELLQLADQALYQAKTAGRNCVKIYQNPNPFHFEPYEKAEQLLGQAEYNFLNRPKK
ncbi:MAG: hypothetical protein JWP00_2887 [Chloroflexi bacterium]|jgi:diguanylate cyclase (GGDEF)-like protein|nr:hypothetical protein [Chloroflexota bacterium]